MSCRRRLRGAPDTAVATLVALAAALTLCRTASARPSAQPELSAVSSHLRGAHALARQRMPVAQIADTDEVLRWRADKLEIELRFTQLDASTVDAIRALGADIDHVSYRYRRVLAVADPALLPMLAALPGVATIHPSYGAQRSSGAIAGQGDASIRADAARAQFGVDGSGVRVGLLSDSFAVQRRGSVTGTGCARQVTGAAGQLSGDLPSEVVLLDEGPLNSADEGEAMAEIVHDIAPGATLLFATAFSDEATFADNIDALAACGVDVLADDVLYYAEPMYQDGIIAQAAQAAVDGGAAFFSAIGNQARGGVEAAYRDAVPGTDDQASTPTGDDFHDFGGGNRFAAITVPARCGVRLVLQWDEPFSGTLGPGASSDLDLYVFSGQSPTADLLANGTDSQGCSMPDGGPGGDPLELLVYTNTGRSARTVYVAVDHFCGRPDVRFRIVSFPTCVLSNAYTFEPDVFDAVQIYGHPAAAGVTAMAAVFYGEVDSAGAAMGAVDEINVEPFSARGGNVPIAFDAAGMPLAGGPVLRTKPELTGPDGVNTSFFGSDLTFDDDVFPNFLGTSAAAPHAAAVAALLRQAHPELAMRHLVDALRASAVDIEAPGPDALAGDGLIDALGALAALPAATASPTASPLPTPTAVTRAGDCNGDGLVTIDELIVAVGIALGQAPAPCDADDSDGDGHVNIDDLIRAVAGAL